MTFPRICDKCGDTWQCNGCNARTSHQCWCKKCLGEAKTSDGRRELKNCFPEPRDIKEVVVFT